MTNMRTPAKIIPRAFPGIKPDEVQEIIMNSNIKSYDAGTFKAFDATCTHQQCTVGSIKDGTIICPCHGSMYSVKDGSVTGGPAPKSLSAIAVKVDGDEVVKA